jgi:alcohol oxidase
MRYISPDGRRQDAAHRYLHPLLQGGQHPNIHVLVESQVVRIIFEEKRAVGIAFRTNSEPKNQDKPQTEDLSVVKARKLVILSCGGCGSPLVLERSGIGSTEVLKRAGVPVVTHLPGIGAQYLDHPGMIYAYKSSLAPEETMDNFLSSGFSNVPELIGKNDPILGWNAMDITSKIRPDDNAIAALGEDFQQYWDEGYKSTPDKPMSIITLVNG